MELKKNLDILGVRHGDVIGDMIPSGQTQTSLPENKERPVSLESMCLLWSGKGSSLSTLCNTNSN